MSISIKVQNNISKNLNSLFKKIQDPTPALKQIGVLEKGQTQLRFNRSQDPSGKPWEKLALKTIAQRRKNSSIPLLDTGRLRNSITFFTTKNSVVIGTNVVYGPVHQYGSKKKNIPARPFLGINQKTVENVTNVIKRFLGL